MNVNKLLKNKMLLYVAYGLAVINILGYVNLGSFECLAVFGIAFYILRHFTKNMTLQIFGGLLVSNVVFGCGRVREGMKEGNKNDDDDDDKKHPTNLNDVQEILKKLGK